jgi:glucose/arabinose dehydrogenase
MALTGRTGGSAATAQTAGGSGRAGSLWRMVEGDPIDSRSPEKADDKPAFFGQTRAPYHATAPVVVTTLTDRLHLPWSLAFLPDGNMLITEKPGTMRILNTQGVLSEPMFTCSLTRRQTANC